MRNHLLNLVLSPENGGHLFSDSSLSFWLGTAIAGGFTGFGGVGGGRVPTRVIGWITSWGSSPGSGVHGREVSVTGRRISG
ncbi:hypothetical protein P691DRAFT_768425 [Macrolepiota fuliginosa MF-IS2]|uniref:Uncharacterized protein n=1 Tax=Macrolepiota fuliginosa MF-IS2 TaxID=1400762 RepID=A0A9P5WYE6_9AGAR|nr:hypothetical protein P691DRAFT_768425 [Macrolepiota fuliginosa MF-IS2]